MGFSLSGIVSDIKSLASDPGKVAKDICDAVLPQNLKAVGDVVGGAIDIETGNPLQALSHLADALKDLPQMAQGLPGTTAGKTPSTPAGTAAAEPTPPPPRAPSLQQVISELTALAGGGAKTTAQTGSAAAAPAATPTATASATTASPAAAPATPAPPDVSVPAGSTSAAPTNAARSQVTISVASNGRTVNVSERHTTTTGAEPYRAPTVRTRGWNPTPALPTVTITATNTSAPTSAASGGATAAPAPPASSSSTGASTSTGAAAPPAAAGASSPTGAPASTGTAASTSAATPSSLSSLMSMSNDQFMQAVTSGNIPADVANNPSAMAEIQARMNQITQMNQLVTSMMAAMHQMQMAIIQNIRV
jgi:hypothetical protein